VCGPAMRDALQVEAALPLGGGGGGGGVRGVGEGGGGGGSGGDQGGSLPEVPNLRAIK